MRKRKILFISSNPDLKTQLFPSARYEAVYEKSAVGARQRMSSEKFDLVMVSGPLNDESSTRLAGELSSIHRIPVLLAVNNEIYDQACYQTQEQNVFVLCLPLQKNMALQAISILEKFSDQTRFLERQIQKEQQKLKDEKMISLCKLKLIENYHWSEEKAHSFIGKKAMDHSTTRVNIAKVLLNRLQAPA